MWSTFKLVRRIETSASINAFIFWMKKFFLTKSLFRDVGYGNYEAKKRFTYLALVFRFIKEIFKTFLIAFFGIAYPMSVFYKVDTPNHYNFFMHLFVCFYVVWGCLSNSVLLRSDQDHFSYIKLVHIDAKTYVFSKFLVKRLLGLVGEIPVFCGAAYILGGTCLPMLCLIFAKLFFRCFAEMVHLMFFRKTSKTLDRQVILYFILMGCIVGIGILPRIFKIPLNYNNTVIYIISLVIFLLGVIGLTFMLKFNNYFEIVDAINKPNNFNIDLNAKEIRTSTLSVKDKNVTNLNTQKFSNKKGFEYFNEIFFERFKSSIYGHVKWKVAVVTILFAFFAVGGSFMPELRELYITNVSVNNFGYITMILYYMFSTAQIKTVRLLFFNCDLPLLKYGIYSSDKDVYDGFKYRLKKILPIGFSVSGSIVAAILCLNVLFKIAITTQTLVLCTFIILYSTFLVFNSLALYYLYQPFSESLEVKNSMYSNIQIVIIFVAFVLPTLSIANKSVLAIVYSLAIVLYMIVAMVLVKRSCSKTFKIRK